MIVVICSLRVSILILEGSLTVRLRYNKILAQGYIFSNHFHMYLFNLRDRCGECFTDETVELKGCGTCTNGLPSSENLGLNEPVASSGAPYLSKAKRSSFHPYLSAHSPSQSCREQIIIILNQNFLTSLSRR